MGRHGRARTRIRWWIPVGVIGVALVLIAAIVLVNRNSAGSPDAEQADTANGGPGESGAPISEVEGPAQPRIDEVERREESDPLTLGPVDAPVALVVFSDYQCPYCARWSEETLPRMKDYAEAGDLRIEWRDVNVYGEASVRAAKASYAAALQGDYWKYHDALYAGGKIRPENELTAEALVELADKLGLDTTQFEKDMESGETTTAVEENAALGAELGAFSTPAFFVGGQPIVGSQPTDVFVDAVETALSDQGGEQGGAQEQPNETPEGQG